MPRDSGISFNSSLAASRKTSYASLSPKTAFSANVTPPLPPLSYTNDYLSYGQLVAVLWPVYGNNSYAEARKRFLAQQRILEQPRLKKKKSLWSLFSGDD
ncbi:hypothetical protein CJU89_6356 [Yarrowia sp. B02]|nr:hypothetical protein CJU89_6356 [Yarrowia sp. B02]